MGKDSKKNTIVDRLNIVRYLKNKRKAAKDNILSETNLIKSFEDPEQFQKLILNIEYFREAAKKYPAQKARLFNLIFRDTDEFKRLITNYVLLWSFAEDFPEYAGAILDVVLNDLVKFEYLFESFFVFIFLADKFSAQENKFALVFQNLELFKRLFTDDISLVTFLQSFPCYNGMVAEVLVKNPEEFSRIIPNYDRFFSLCTGVPALKDPLMKHLLRNPEEFKRIFKEPIKLRRAARQFPVYSKILSQPSIEEAVKAVELYQKSCVEIRKNARLMAQATRTSPFFRGLDMMPGVLATIAGYTANSKVHDKEEARTIAEEHLCRPPTP